MAANLRYFCRKGLELGETLRSVNVESFATMIVSFDNIAIALRVCPAISTPELEDFNPNAPGDLTTEQIQHGISIGIPIGELVNLPVAERMRRIDEAIKALEAAAASTAPDAASHTPPGEQPPAEVPAADFGEAGSLPVTETPGGQAEDSTTLPSGQIAVAPTSLPEALDHAASLQPMDAAAGAAASATGVQLQSAQFAEPSANQPE
jgi:hypothetical protein